MNILLKAIKQVWCSTKIIVCLWHILNRNLSWCFNSYEGFKDQFFECVRADLDDFETQWNILYNWTGINQSCKLILDGLYEQRRGWVKAWVNLHFNAGSSSNSRSESMNAAIKAHLRSAIRKRPDLLVDLLQNLSVKQNEYHVLKVSEPMFKPVELVNKDELEMLVGLYSQYALVKLDTQLTLSKNREKITLDVDNTKGGISRVKDEDKAYDVDLSRVECGCLYISKRLIVCRHWLYVAQMFQSPFQVLSTAAEKMLRWKIDAPEENAGEEFQDVREWVALKAERLQKEYADNINPFNKA